MFIQNVFRVQLYFEYPSRDIERAKKELSGTLNTVVSYTQRTSEGISRERRYDFMPQQRAALTRALEAAPSWPGLILRVRQAETIARFSEFPETEGAHHFIEVTLGIVEPSKVEDIANSLLAVMSAALENPYVRRPVSWAVMFGNGGWQKVVRSSKGEAFARDEVRKNILPLVQQLVFPESSNE